MVDEHRNHSRDFVASLEKGLNVLMCFDRKHPKLNLSEVAQLTGYTPATARRLLLTLEALNFLQTDGKRFWVTPRALLLARPYLVSRPAPQLAQPILDALAERTRQSASLATLVDDDVLVIARSTGRRTLSTGLSIGSRLPVYCSALGRAIFSTKSEAQVMQYLQDVVFEAWTPKTAQTPEAAYQEIAGCRQRGWAACNEEVEMGVRSIAVPILNSSGEALGAISLSVRAERMSLDSFVATHLEALLAASKQLATSKVLDEPLPRSRSVKARTGPL